MIFYFSGVGNSAWVAQSLAKKLNDTAIVITDSNSEEYQIQPSEAIGFVFPVYSWAPPKVVINFINSLKINTPNYLYFVCTCGDDTGKTADVFANTVKQRGWLCHAGYSITMPNTYVSLPGFGIDSDEIEKQKIEKAKIRIEQIISDIKSQKRMTKYDCREGSIPRFKTYIINPLFTKYQLTTKPFHTTDACISCHQCEQKCPLQNIILVDGKPQWGNKCTQCEACFHICPTNAIQYDKNTKGKQQYKGKLLKL
jgi:ferredoxin